MSVMKNKTTGQKWKYEQIIYLICLSLFTFIWILPILWSLSTSFRTEEAIRSNLTGLLPTPFTTEHYEYILAGNSAYRWLLNSFIVSGVRTVSQIFVCSLAAYAITRMKIYGKRIFLPIILLGIMVPFQAVFIPVYLLFSDLDLHNSYFALIIPEVGSPIALFLLVQFFQGIPKELDEAAYLDGANHFTVYWKIILPLSTPILMTLAIFTFLGTWNEYLWPLISATDRDMLTITIGLRKMVDTFGHGVEVLGRRVAAAWVAGLPIFIFFIIFQRRIISGIKLTSGIN